MSAHNQLDTKPEPCAPAIQLINLTKIHSNGEHHTRVLHNLSLQILQGELVAIVGASGSGKSTLLHILGLLDTDYTGHYALNGHAVDQLNEPTRAHLRNRCIGFVFQQFYLLPGLDALHNVALPLLYRNTSFRKATEAAMHALADVGMQDYATRQPTQLSGGQQQRIAIARALIGEPDVILADEPTGSLDSNTSADIMQLFHTLQNKGKTIVLITHEQAIATHCQRQLILADGCLIDDIKL